MSHRSRPQQGAPAEPTAWYAVTNPIKVRRPAQLLTRPLTRQNALPTERPKGGPGTAAAPAPHVCGSARQAPKQQAPDPDPSGLGSLQAQRRSRGSVAARRAQLRIDHVQQRGALAELQPDRRAHARQRRRGGPQP